MKRQELEDREELRRIKKAYKKIECSVLKICKEIKGIRNDLIKEIKEEKWK